MATARVTKSWLEVLRSGAPKARATKAWLEVLRSGTPKVRATRTWLEVLVDVGSPPVQVSYETSTAADHWPVLNTPWSFETTTGNTGAELVDEDLEFETAVELLAYSGGTIDAGPAAGPFEFETVTLVGQQALFSPPTLVSYTNVTAVGAAVEVGQPATFETVTGARITVRMRFDGRIGLIDDRRYRR